MKPPLTLLWGQLYKTLGTYACKRGPGGYDLARRAATYLFSNDKVVIPRVGYSRATSIQIRSSQSVMIQPLERLEAFQYLEVGITYSGPVAWL
jgi:hypothetical protein